MHAQGKNTEKRAVILHAAAELFTEKDFHLVLMDHVAERAQVGKGTVYRYFPTKEDLYFAIIFEGWDRLREHLEAVLQEEGSIEDRLEKVSRQILSYFWQRRQFVTLVHRLEHETSSKQKADWQRRRESIVRLVEGIVKKERGADALPNGQTQLITEMFLGMLRSIILYRGPRDTPETLAHLVVRLFFDGLRAYTERKEHVSPRTAAGGKTP
jgi:AcrR family transcriptional regulator